MSGSVFSRAGGVCFFFALLMLFGCGKRPESASHTNNVFGKDERRPLTERKRPWTAIGRLGSGCTASLIAPRRILTAAHCLYRREKNRDGKTTRFVELENARTFLPFAIEGQSSASATIVHIIKGDKPRWAKRSDWAIAILDRDLGSEFGTLPIAAVGDDELVGMTVTSAGYSKDYAGGYSPTIQDECRIKSAETDYVFHDCDDARGASGGPMLRKGTTGYEIVALNVGELRGGNVESLTLDEYSPYFANTAAPLVAAKFLLGVLPSDEALLKEKRNEGK